MMALHSGGHVRTGLEDRTYLFHDRLATGNAELVEQWVKTASIWGRPIASPTQARDMLGLKPLAVSAQVSRDRADVPRDKSKKETTI